MAALLLLLAPGLRAGQAEHNLIQMLLEAEHRFDPLPHAVSAGEGDNFTFKYNPLERPVLDTRDPVPLIFGITSVPGPPSAALQAPADCRP
jgi:hypothetical protein